MITLVTALILASAPAAARDAAKAPKTPEAYVLTAAMVADGGDLAMGERILRDGIKDFPTSSGMHVVLGAILEKRGENAEAFYEYQWEAALSGPGADASEEASRRSALLMKQRHPDTDELLRVLHALQQRDPAKGLAAMTRVGMKRGHRTVIDLYRAEMAARAGDVDTAIAAFRTTIEEAPSLVPAYVELASALVKKGDAKEAAAVLERARSIDPESWALRN